MTDDMSSVNVDDGQSIPDALAATPKPKAARAKAMKFDPAVPIAEAVSFVPDIAAAAIAVPDVIVPEIVVRETITPDIIVDAPVFTPPAAVPAELPKEIIMATTIENVTTDTNAKAQAMFADAGERAKGAMAKSAKAFEDMNAFGKGNVEALVESSKIAAKGIETLGQGAAEYTRKSFEDATAAFKTLASVKSPTEFMKLQSDFMRSMFDAMVAETSRSTETMLKLAGEVVQPISNRMAVAADKMKIAA